jgi:hypothetical protein
MALWAVQTDLSTVKLQDDKKFIQAISGDKKSEGSSFT